jgi:hypothetical protein
MPRTGRTAGRRFGNETLSIDGAGDASTAMRLRHCRADVIFLSGHADGYTRPKD